MHLLRGTHLIERKIIPIRLIPVHELLQLNGPKFLTEVLPVRRYMLVCCILAKPGRNILRIWDSRAEGDKTDVRTDRFHPRHDSFQGRSASLFENMDLIDKEQLDELHESRMVLPFAGHAVPFLWGGDNDLAILHASQLRLVCVAGQFGTLQTESAEFSAPIAESLGAQRLCRRLVDYFEAFVLQVI